MIKWASVGVGLLLILAGCGLMGNQVDIAQNLPGTWVTSEEHSAPIEPFLAVDKNGVWLASDGCNVVQGTWKADKELVVTSGPSTLIACDGVAVPSAFANVKEVEFTKEGWLVLDGKMTLRLSFGAPAMEAPTVYLRAWGPEGSADEPWIKFNPDGTFNAFDGCNVLGGEYTHDYGVLDLSFGMSTKKYCEGVDDWLGKSVAAYLYDGALGFFAEDGTATGTLSIENK